MLNMRVGRTFRFGTVRERAAAENTGGGVGGGGTDTRGTPASPFGVASSGQGGASTARRFSLTISMRIRNLLNHNNPGVIIGEHRVAAIWSRKSAGRIEHGAVLRKRE
jgi:hypothetical protein